MKLPRWFVMFRRAYTVLVASCVGAALCLVLVFPSFRDLGDALFYWGMIAFASVVLMWVPRFLIGW